ncbi:Eukaryotic translation initiation factor 3 subunit D [Oopsacas minuta]|uniref:Eukaryotic translation initiation factor 3 subunit D n=1 Tax=Oopsacas minuta TaxID=111878 RepID=A0AAV7JHT7_9METZ|nr:Eukaryotic translation initiation factor 3 subunit D [Oopsacas minuta]
MRLLALPKTLRKTRRCFPSNEELESEVFDALESGPSNDWYHLSKVGCCVCKAAWLLMANILREFMHFINYIQCFTIEVLKRDKTFNAKNINPFYDEAIKQPLAPILYRYRRWQLKEVPVIIRCEVNGMLGENFYCNIRTLNEYDPKITDDWRRKLELQKGAVIATELKNNSNKLAKCTISSILSGCDLIKLGYVSRDNFYSPKSHVILGTQDFLPSFLASQVSLELNNCWGVLHVLIQECLKLKEGKYFLVRDSTKHVLKLYQTSGESEDSFDFENEDSDSNSDNSCDA